MNTRFVVAAVSMMSAALAAQPVQAQRPTVQRDLAVGSSSPERADRTFSKLVTVRLDRVTVRRAVDALASSAGVQIQYRSEFLDAVSEPVTLHAQRLPLGDALDQVLAGTRLAAVSSIENVVTIQPTVARTIGQGVVTGKVTDGKTGRPVAGATIVLDGATKGVQTGEDGTFRLPASVGEHTITVRALGFVKTSRSVTVSEGENASLALTLTASASVLDEVVVTGSVVATERRAITTPITVITAKDIEARGVTRIDQLFRGEVPGVYMLDAGADTYSYATGYNAGVNVKSRGSARLGSSFGPSSDLKTYIDGVEMMDPSYVGTIDPKSIERIEIITGPQAATVYGSGALGGVMQIFTKKGGRQSAPDITLSLRYGMLESNASSSLTPTHNHTISVVGGEGPAFSYSTNLSYTYTGQWQPALFRRSIGSSVGATYTRDRITASGSASLTRGTNGTWEDGWGLFRRNGAETGEFGVPPDGMVLSPRRGSAGSQTLAFNADFKGMSWWTHHLTAGTSQTSFGSNSVRPRYSAPNDTLLKRSNQTGIRSTLGYNMTMAPAPIGMLSVSLTTGLTGSSGRMVATFGCKQTSVATAIVACATYSPQTISESTDQSYGGFGSLRLGAGNLYLTLGVRGERNPFYGRAHRIDWTPSNGIAYTMELGDVSLKFLGSYGRATRAPSPEARLSYKTTATDYEPSVLELQRGNPNIMPEYSRGPQGGVEMYVGNVGSLTVNRYTQKVKGLIQSVMVDSIGVIYLPTGGQLRFYVYQNLNVADVDQHGWEITGSSSIGVLSFRGTYTWNDSRVSAVPPGSSYWVGQSFPGTPTHMGSATIGYAHGGTSISVITNYRGKMNVNDTGMSSNSKQTYYDGSLRIQTYRSRRLTRIGEGEQVGYAKSNLAASQRLASWASFTVNVDNLGNSYGSETSYYGNPSLGRTTTLGLSLRFPNR